MRSDGPRLRERRNSVLSRSYLVYRHLWPALESAIADARSMVGARDTLSVLDVGCGEKPYRDLFEGCAYIGLNYSTDHASPDVVGDAQKLPFADGSFDIVFSTQVIEHVPNPRDLCREAHRVLRKGGAFVCSGPFVWPLHEEPHDYFRFTRYGFEKLLREAGFAAPQIRPDTGALTQAMVTLVHLVPKWLFPLVPLMNVVTPLLQRVSADDKSTLNYVCVAVRP